jgi:hypothetical protein
MFRKPLPYIILAVFGVAGFLAWINLESPAATEATSESAQRPPLPQPLLAHHHCLQLHRLLLLLLLPQGALLCT